MTNTILPSWKEAPVRQSLIDFVERATNARDPGFIVPADRIAVFDNDGTLWTEQSVPVEVFFAMDKAREQAENDPNLKDSPLFNAFIEKDLKTILTFSRKEIIELLIRTHKGRTPSEFQSSVRNWFDNAVHPRFKFSFYDAAFKPQIELLEHLRENGFKTFIVSGGGIDFIRTISEKIYGIPREMVVGSSGVTKIEYEGSKPVIMREPELRSFDDRDEKINNLHLHIGSRPVFTFGNSDGDLAMLRFTLAGEGPKMALLLHHDDDEREVAYDKDFKISPLNEALNVADAEGINVVSMKNDWNTVF